MMFTDENMTLLNKLLKTPIEDTQFYQGYPERCKAYAKALPDLLHRLECAEKLIRWYDRYIDARTERPYKRWLQSKGAARE